MYRFQVLAISLVKLSKRTILAYVCVYFGRTCKFPVHFKLQYNPAVVVFVVWFRKQTMNIPQRDREAQIHVCENRESCSISELFIAQLTQFHAIRAVY